ncbi:hypothetical protein E4Z66_15780 [Aliishimia ponticola]|uniref:Uncharacterized protein n=1 Tax=Aliishimia ponticola TaxID=2499833 RepID=A0A4S4N846_9RHOB|nr:hypothetical protein [Aliishimia ponticola]THH35279.1 hypothetical protein E4Z66_15780 [Aliishimia ponticola]
MFSECEHSCLLQMAKACKQRGMTRAEAIRSIETELCGFSSPFRIGQAVNTAFSPNPQPDLV